MVIGHLPHWSMVNGGEVSSRESHVSRVTWLIDGAGFRLRSRGYRVSDPRKKSLILTQRASIDVWSKVLCKLLETDGGVGGKD